MRKERDWGVRKFGKLESGDWLCQLTKEEANGKALRFKLGLSAKYCHYFCTRSALDILPIKEYNICQEDEYEVCFRRGDGESMGNFAA